jgi:hypothetical protein
MISGNDKMKSFINTNSSKDISAIRRWFRITNHSVSPVSAVATKSMANVSKPKDDKVKIEMLAV